MRSEFIRKLKRSLLTDTTMTKLLGFSNESLKVADRLPLVLLEDYLFQEDVLENWGMENLCCREDYTLPRAQQMHLII